MCLNSFYLTGNRVRLCYRVTPFKFVEGAMRFHRHSKSYVIYCCSLKGLNVFERKVIVVMKDFSIRMLIMI